MFELTFGRAKNDSKNLQVPMLSQFSLLISVS